jgi:hypothetical protein
MPDSRAPTAASTCVRRRIQRPSLRAPASVEREICVRALTDSLSRVTLLGRTSFAVGLVSTACLCVRCSESYQRAPASASHDAGYEASSADCGAACGSPFCPDPRHAATGGACDPPSITRCQTTKVLDPCDGGTRLQSCDCLNGQWACDDEPSCVWPGPCPQPSDLLAGAPCAIGDAGEGALSDCRGQWYLCGTDIITADDYACVSGRWMFTAGLICADAGF